MRPEPGAAIGSTWLRPSVLTAGFFVLALLIGGVVADASAGSESTAAQYVQQLGQLGSAVLATAASCFAVARHCGRPDELWDTGRPGLNDWADQVPPVLTAPPVP